MILSEKHDQVLQAFVKARGFIGTGVKKDRRNDHLKSSYATLDSVMNVITPAMNEAGLTIIQNATRIDANVSVTTILMHNESFQTITFESLIPIAKMDGQGFGSGFTYGRRYALLGAFGLVPTDDDGQATKRTANDVKRALDGAEDKDALDEIFKKAKQYFAGDATSINVISAHYDKLKSDMLIGGAKGFNPLQKKVKPETKSDESETVDDAPASSPMDF